MITVESHGAFGANRVGVERLPFPLSFSVGEAEGSWTVSGAAARAWELIDVFTRTANDTVVVLNLESNSLFDKDNRPWPPSRIAAQRGVDCTARAVGGRAPGSMDLGEELLMMRRDDLPRFLGGGWAPYELSLVDVPAGTTAAQLDALDLAVGAAVVAGEPVLPRLGGSRFWYSGHDDCYLMAESTDPAVPPALLARLLALLAGSALIGAGHAAPVEVPEPDEALPRRLIAESPHWVGSVRKVSGTTVTVGLSALPRPWRLGEQPPEQPGYAATLDLALGGWRLASGGSESVPLR
ncbi:hypothetical protein [Streptomyces sp. CBMA156]|uniref:hypothetical protein n=1 Tax=Streptomyces sp. CBMA156 TaxID=1930280 RepID=UPI001662154F|nr:hypothetical protein [Streptomyces sp. CBMA156]MBD0669946.1 hypothetical protein [Streptomyces sp. CBMA156]MBD0670511.1 hypothetical protein [Streptomyces sp. CBMA156]